MRLHRFALIAGTALAGLASLPAEAQTAREAKLEPCLRMLEQAVSDLRAELRTQRAAPETTTAPATPSPPTAVASAGAPGQTAGALPTGGGAARQPESSVGRNGPPSRTSPSCRKRPISSARSTAPCSIARRSSATRARSRRA